MNTPPLTALALAAALGAFGCNEDTAPFLPLEQLCPAIAEDLCDAQSHCQCEEVKDCADRVKARCEAQREQLTDESELSYDGQTADRVRDRQQQALLECEAPVPVARFFEGIKGPGDACERDAQCDSLSCAGEPGHCADVESVPLCDWDDT